MDRVQCSLIKRRVISNKLYLRDFPAERVSSQQELLEWGDYHPWQVMSQGARSASSSLCFQHQQEQLPSELACQAMPPQCLIPNGLIATIKKRKLMALRAGIFQENRGYSNDALVFIEAFIPLKRNLLTKRRMIH